MMCGPFDLYQNHKDGNGQYKHLNGGKPLWVGIVFHYYCLTRISNLKLAGGSGENTIEITDNRQKSNISVNTNTGW